MAAIIVLKELRFGIFLCLSFYKFSLIVP